MHMWVSLLLQHFIKLPIPTDIWEADRKLEGNFRCLKKKCAELRLTDLNPTTQAQAAAGIWLLLIKQSIAFQRQGD